MAGELDAGRAFVDLVPKLNKGAAAATQAQMGGMFSGLAGKAKLAGAAIGVGLGAAAVGAGVAAFKIGQTFDSAFDTIRIGTGATGEALAGLEQSFRNVAKGVPDDFGKVSTAIADLNTRTGQSGPQLEALATQMLTLARVTGEDLGSTIEKQTRFFGDWGVAVEDQAGSLDYLFRVSQSTGIGINDLSGKLVQFGAPLRQLGFSMEESAALLGKFEKEGVNAELVMGSFRIALGKMAREGEPAQETLARVTDEIANAGDSSEANALALELFGARAGPDMAAAIREGRFEVSDLVDTLSSGGDTIMGVAGETDGLGETFARLKNKVMLGVEPLATGFLRFLEDALPKLEPLVDAIGVFLPQAFAEVGRVVGPIVEIVGKVARAFSLLGGDDGIQGFAEVMDNALGNSGKFVGFFRELGGWILRIGDFIRDNLKPILVTLGVAFALLVAPVATVVAGLVLAYQRFEGFRNVVDTVVRFLLAEVVPRVTEFAGYVAEQFGNLVAWVREHWASIQEAVGHVVEVIRAIVTGFVDAVLIYWGYFGDTILTILANAWENVRAVVEFAVALVAGIIETAVALINGDWGAAWDAFTGIFSAAWELVKTLLGNALEIIGSLLGAGMDLARDLVSGALDKIVGFFRDLPGRLAGAAGDVFGFLWESFRGAINKVIDGWNDLEFKIPGFDPPGPGPKFGGFTLGLPTVPRLAEGGTALERGLAIVGEGSYDGELVDLPAGAVVTPLDTAAMIAEAAGTAGAQPASLFRDIIVPTATDATADEVVDAILTKAGWKLTTRNDGRA